LERSVQALLGFRSGGAGVLGGMHAFAPSDLPPAAPLVVGHRGAPAYRPEHTRESFELAIDLGADMIEPDVLVSRDGALVVRHESALSLTTDVASRPEFADRRRVGRFEGRRVRDWFVEDFDLAELRTLRAVERMPGLRPLNTAYDGRSGVLTLAEVIEVARARGAGVLAELKPAADAARLASLVTDELTRTGCPADGPVVLQSFDAAVLREIRALTGDGGPRMVQLVSDSPVDDGLVTPVGLREVSTYAQGIGPSRGRLLPLDERGRVVPAAGLVAEAHSAALAVFCWTLRAENAFLPPQLRRGSHPAGQGDAVGQARLLLDLGVDGLIADSPEHAVMACEAMTLRPSGPRPRPGAVPLLR
jgi:glycerophosphoryl diester phosphodiesterase